MLLYSLFLLQVLTVRSQHLQPDALRLHQGHGQYFSEQAIVCIHQRNQNLIYILHDREISRYTKSTNGSISRLVPISLSKEGPQGIGKLEYEGLSICGINCIMLYSYWGRQLAWLDTNGICLKKVRLPEWSEKEPVIQASAGQSFFSVGSKVLLGGHIYQTYAKGTLKGPIAVLDTSIHKIEYIGRYPEKTYQGSWGISHINYLEKVDSATYLYSSTISDSIQEITLRPYTVRNFRATSSYVDPILPLSPDYAFDNGANIDQLNEYTMKAKYFNVIYDRHNGLIYRFVLHEKAAKDSYHTFSAVVMDKNYEVLGEVKLEQGVYPQYSFLDDEGIYMLDKRHYDEVSDSYLSFHLLNYCLKE